MNNHKTVMITGASGGLGSAIALAFANAGYALVLLVKQQDDRSEKLLKQLSAITHSVKCYSADLTNILETESLFENLRKEYSSLYAVINNAGIPFSGMSWKQTAEEWDHVFDINIRAPWLVSRLAIPLLRNNKEGRLIYVSSIVAHRPLAGTSAYAASKAALEGLTRAQAVELSRFGITVNCVAPGYFNTGMIDSVSAEQQTELSAKTPVSRLGTATELAAHMLYLCSKEAAFITGQIHHINGGLYL